MRFLRKLHKWLGLIVFAWLDHHAVMGEHSVREAQPPVLTDSRSFVEPASWLGEVKPNEILEIRLAPVLDTWVWRVETMQGVMLRDAATGEIWRLTEASARRLAQQHYAGAGQLVSVAFHPNATIETRDSGATWEARFEDDRGTTLYFAADDGRLVQTRNDNWRLFDFFWMLHTMDYQGRDNFNNPLVITIGFAALWLTLSGFLLLFKSFRRQDFAFVTGWRQK
jgi:uncharacterized iron-regulated membrane protein